MLGYAAALKQRGVLLAANALKSDALRVTMERGRAQVLDGPFTESKELIGGYFLLDCGTRDEALSPARATVPPPHGRASKCARSAPATSEAAARRRATSAPPRSCTSPPPSLPCRGRSGTAPGRAVGPLVQRTVGAGAAGLGRVRGLGVLGVLHRLGFRRSGGARASPGPPRRGARGLPRAVRARRRAARRLSRLRRDDEWMRDITGVSLARMQAR